MLYFTLLYFTLLYFTLLYFTLLYFTLLYFTLLYLSRLCVLDQLMNWSNCLALKQLIYTERSKKFVQISRYTLKCLIYSINVAMTIKLCLWRQTFYVSHFPIEQRTGSSWCLEGRLEGQQVIVSELNIYQNMPYYNCCVSGCTNNFRNVGKLPRCHIRHIVYFLSLQTSD
jgi:hypothetical protein